MYQLDVLFKRLHLNLPRRYVQRESNLVTLGVLKAPFEHSGELEHLWPAIDLWLALVALHTLQDVGHLHLLLHQVCAARVQLFHHREQLDSKIRAVGRSRG